MDQTLTLERPTALPQVCPAPLARRELHATKGLMLHQLCTLTHEMRSMAVKQILSEQELDLRDWLTLSTLCELGSGTQRDIARTSGLDKVAVNRAVARLKEKGLVTAQPNLRDGRSHLLELTDLGNAVTLTCSNELVEFERSLLDGFSERERKELRRLLDALGNRVARG